MTKETQDRFARSVTVNVVANIVAAAMIYLLAVVGLVMLALAITAGLVVIGALGAFVYILGRYFRKPAFWLVVLLFWVFKSSTSTASDRKINRVFLNDYLAAMKAYPPRGDRLERTIEPRPQALSRQS